MHCLKKTTTYYKAETLLQKEDVRHIVLHSDDTADIRQVMMRQLKMFGIETGVDFCKDRPVLLTTFLGEGIIGELEDALLGFGMFTDDAT